ncbi:MAG TPA: kelch repeat-containing protein [Miltoncostaeaceae bacterium]|nr:kelch repeat-containing protein [Miltoncostaeaceae bacterium]
MRHLPAALALVMVLLVAGCSGDAASWRLLPSAPQARTEVAGAALNGRVAVVGGLTADGAVSARADLYDPTRRRWLRLPDMPAPRHHAMAASRRDRLYVAGGFAEHHAGGQATDTAWVLYDRAWHPLPPMPEPRAAGGAVIVRNRLYVVGGVGAGPGRPLATTSMYLDLRTLRWRLFRGLATPREHLGVTALGGRVYAIGGRTGGPATNTHAAEAYDTVRRAWSTLPDAPTRRGGNGATRASGLVVAVGGEARTATIAPVDAYDPGTRTWRSLTPSPRPRHGGAVVGIGRTVYQALGGPEPGLTVSNTLMGLRVPAD